jgi:DNA polymerase-3 subunit epsilon
LAEVYLAMTRGQETLTMELAAPAAAASTTVDVAALPSLRVLEPSAAELAAHRAYLAEVDREAGGRCIWLALEYAPRPAASAPEPAAVT